MIWDLWEFLSAGFLGYRPKLKYRGAGNLSLCVRLRFDPSIPYVPCIRIGSTVEWQIRAPLLLMCDIALSSSQVCPLPASPHLRGLDP